MLILFFFSLGLRLLSQATISGHILSSVKSPPNHSLVYLWFISPRNLSSPHQVVPLFRFGISFSFGNYLLTPWVGHPLEHFPLLPLVSLTCFLVNTEFASSPVASVSSGISHLTLRPLSRTSDFLLKIYPIEWRSVALPLLQLPNQNMYNSTDSRLRLGI